MKKRTLTNRELSEKLKIPIGKVRRNTKEFLGSDPIATKRSGYQREFSINDGFFVYFGTILVSKHGLSFDNARKAIDLVKPWLLKIGEVPDPPKGSRIRGILKEIEYFFITFYIRQGELINIFKVTGNIFGEEFKLKKDSFGFKYEEVVRKEAHYYIKNDSGKIRYFLVDEKTHEMLWDECDHISDVELTELERKFAGAILDRNEIRLWIDHSRGDDN